MPHPSAANNGFTALTVGRIDSGVAIVLTEDLEMLELPSSLLPPGTTASSIVRLQISSAADMKAQRQAELLTLQQKLLRDFGTTPDIVAIAKCLTLGNATHTTVTVKWPTWQLMCPGSRATIYSIDGFLNERAFSAAKIAPEETTLKLTGLEPNRTYTLRLAFRTSAGRYTTDPLSVSTRPLEDLSCLRVAVDSLSAETIEELTAIGVQVGAFSSDTSLVVSGRSGPELEAGGIDDGELLRSSKYANVPIVTPEWVRSCKESGRMQSVSQFYPL